MKKTEGMLRRSDTTFDNISSQSHGGVEKTLRKSLRKARYIFEAYKT